jgi:choline dehydrogenase-like flavoprotein
MGSTDDDGAVVDPRLRLRGVGRLRVADASIFPEIVLVNPALTCMLVGERCAELILADASGSVDEGDHEIADRAVVRLEGNAQ